MLHKKGRLEIVCGSMFSGKSEELIRRLRRAEFARQNIQVFKPEIDNRHTTDHVHAHSGDKIGATAVATAQELKKLIAENTSVIGIDEIQFFTQDIIPVVLELIDQGKRIIASGLDLDFRGMPFGCMPGLMAIADNVTKLNAICICCGEEAHFTQRLVNGAPARFNDPLIMIGAEECYQARCRNCYRIQNS